MSIAEALSKGVLLKSVPKAEEKKTQIQLCDNEDQYKQMMEETYLERYYEPIKEYTFASEFVTLSKEAAAALIKFHKEFITYLPDNITTSQGNH
jgi:hypothetical protein